MRSSSDTGQSSDWQARAAEALEKARKMKPGPERNEALKKAGQLQSAADMMGYLSRKICGRRSNRNASAGPILELVS